MRVSSSWAPLIPKDLACYYLEGNTAQDRPVSPLKPPSSWTENFNIASNDILWDCFSDSSYVGGGEPHLFCGISLEEKSYYLKLFCLGRLPFSSSSVEKEEVSLETSLRVFIDTSDGCLLKNPLWSM